MDACILRAEKMERENVMMRKRWNYVERKGMDACILLAETNEKRKCDDEEKMELCRKERN